jgi:hypothetical protein
MRADASPCLRSIVESVTAECAWVALSPSLRGRLACLDGSADVAEAAAFPERFALGRVLQLRVLALDVPRRHVDLTLRATADAKEAAVGGAPLPGRVVRVMPGVGLYVQLPAHRSGRVALTGALPAAPCVHQSPSVWRLRVFRGEEELCPIAILLPVRITQNPLRSTERSTAPRAERLGELLPSVRVLTACALPSLFPCSPQI